ncbi:SNF2-related protein [Paraburkholderia sp. EG286B]|uniref:SNF2-related protein n=1 Tax=Paraburkholderia sp. EG286B TaxID=3237011 RepID=UPI0034D284B6
MIRLFGSKSRGGQFEGRSASKVDVSWGRDGVAFAPNPADSAWLDRPAAFGADSELVLLLRQLDEEGYAKAGPSGALIDWESYYQLEAAESHSASLDLLKLPPNRGWRPALSSRGGLSDANFSITIQGWRDPSGAEPGGDVEIQGAILSADDKQSLLSESAWRAVQAIAERRSSSAERRSPEGNKRDWARIRRYAIDAKADLADFLAKTVVLTPERIDIQMRKGGEGAHDMVEIMPGFDGAPSRWLEIFDRFEGVPDRYEIPDGSGLVHVLLSEDARMVLSEIRRMPGRRVAGARAEAFLRNPFATLGPSAAAMIDPDQFERAREDAGIVFARFSASVIEDQSGYPCEVGLLVEEVFEGEVVAEESKFESASELESFVAKIEGRIAAGAQCCHWKGFDLEILGDSPDQVGKLRSALAKLAQPRRIKASDIFDLLLYSERIEGFGVEKPYYSPFIAKKSVDGGWVPENIDLGLWFTDPKGETVAIPLDGRDLDKFRKEIEQAEQESRETFSFPGCPKPVPTGWAKEALETLGKVREEVKGGNYDPGKDKSGRKAVERTGLVVKPNVDGLDYEERRGELSADNAPPALPSSLRPGIELKDHQREGLAWLQKMWRHSPSACRGALLADDMGLGKTIQLLTFMASLIEAEPRVDPFLVIAPVSLLDNWKAEIEKFFVDGAMDVLMLYGSNLAAKRAPKSALDDVLIESGSPKLLAPGWLGSAKVVLTTYETLRDLEFSLAAQKWSVVVCDEAQKIKNPNAMVTRAAKKQNARLKIACTGTPVENTLADLWCLFDFVQPGLLGSLKDFGGNYRRPIEAETDDEKARIEELRALIEPQKLRRTKAEVAKDLPKKLLHEGCRKLPLSARQRALYADAVAQFKSRGQGQGSGLQSPLGLLQYLRRLCSDPRPPGYIATTDESVEVTRKASPKMNWMLGRLKEIEASGSGDKVIVFCEFRDLQRVIQRAISEVFGFVPDVINGDTSTESGSANSRQARITAYQDAPGFGVIILSPLAVGFGVNIQAANHVIHYTRTWNPAKEDQATDRAYRIGQRKDVHVYYPVVVGGDFVTFDEKLDLLLERKRTLSHDMLNGSGDVTPSEFTDIQAPGGGSPFSEEPFDPADVGSLGPDAFEAFCALMWSKQGYLRTIKTPKTGDGGVDIVAIEGNRGALIQCKSSGVEGKEMGWEAVKDISAGSAAYSARYPGVEFQLFAATNRRFNQSARQQASLLNVTLIEGGDLMDLLSKHPTKRGELDRFAMAGWSR